MANQHQKTEAEAEAATEDEKAERVRLICELWPPPDRNHHRCKGPNQEVREPGGVSRIILPRENEPHVVGIVNTEAWIRVLQLYRWRANHIGRDSENNQWRMVANTAGGKGRSMVYAHRLVAIFYGVAPCVTVIDHIEHPDFDDRSVNNLISNLRPTTIVQNAMNQRGAGTYKGITRCRKKWKASIKINGKRKHLGVFPDEESAARAYDTAARKYFREYANLNFPDENDD